MASSSQDCDGKITSPGKPKGNIKNNSGVSTSSARTTKGSIRKHNGGNSKVSKEDNGFLDIGQTIRTWFRCCRGFYCSPCVIFTTNLVSL